MPSNQTLMIYNRGKYMSLFGGIGAWKEFEILGKSFEDTRFINKICQNKCQF